MESRPIRLVDFAKHDRTEAWVHRQQDTGKLRDSDRIIERIGLGWIGLG